MVPFFVQIFVQSFSRSVVHVSRLFRRTEKYFALSSSLLGEAASVSPEHQASFLWYPSNQGWRRALVTSLLRRAMRPVSAHQVLARNVSVGLRLQHSLCLRPLFDYAHNPE